MTEDRFRKHMRVPLPLVVEVKFDGEEDFQPFLLTDISWGGMYLRMDDLRPIGTPLVASLPSSEEQGGIEVKGKVVTQNKLIEGRTIPGIGVAFEDVDHNAKSLIQKLIDRMLNPGSP